MCCLPRRVQWRRGRGRRRRRRRRRRNRARSVDSYCCCCCSQYCAVCHNHMRHTLFGFAGIRQVKESSRHYRLQTAFGGEISTDYLSLRMHTSHCCIHILVPLWLLACWVQRSYCNIQLFWVVIYLFVLFGLLLLFVFFYIVLVDIGVINASFSNSVNKDPSIECTHYLSINTWMYIYKDQGLYHTWK